MATDERVTEHNVQSEGLGGNAADKKKASKFQPFKKFFGRRKKREATPDRDDTKLKPSSSFGNVCNGVLSSDEETNDGLRSSSYGMGTRAFSHDSIFIPDGRAESEESVQAMSQENILGKVKTLQQQLAKNIKFGQPPQMTVSVKAIGEANASFEADVLLTSPMETETQQDAILPETCNQAGDMPDSLSPVSLPGTRHEAEEKVMPVKSSRPKRHHSPSGTIETVNLDAIPLAIARLDNSAAKHKLSVKPKNQRVSKKHRRLSKELQSMIVSEFEHEIPELQRYEVSKHDGPHTADKPSQHREGQEDKTEGKIKQEDHWRNLETEKKVQMAEAEVKNHLEHKRLQEFGESQRGQEGKKQKLQVEEPFLKMEERKGQEEKKRHEDQRHQELLETRHKELEEQRKKEGGLPEWEIQKQQAEGKHQELEEGKQSEEDRGQDMEVLKEEKPQEEQRHHGQEAQRHQEEQSHWNVDMQRQQELEWQQVDHRRVLEEQKQQELEDQRRKEEKGFRELERKQQLEKLLQQKADKRHEQEKTHLQETKLGQQEGQRGQELEEGTHETGKQEELNQQTAYSLKRQTEQRQEVQKNRNPESEETLQEKKSAVKLEEPKRPEGRRQHLEEAPKRKDGQEQEEPQKTVRSAKLGEGEPAELRQPWAQKRVLHAELMERERGRKLDEQKPSGLEGQHPLGQAKEQDKSFQLPLDKNTRSEEKCLQRFEKELPLKEVTRMQKIQQLDKGQKDEEPLSHNLRKGTEVQEQERILGEELRWQEVDARQTMPRGFTFQVSSGEKQILFHKVNLSPVTPVKEAQTPSATKEVKSPKPSQGSHAVPSSLCVPHTAILVTGAQLCGTAVNLNQIKDTACKSFLGLTEERKMVDIPATENTQKMSPDAKSSSGKTKQPQDSLGNQAILAEWASIRSKILKSAESGKLNEKDKGSLSRHSDDWAPKGRGASHSQLRKTLSANAKFSITPAWQKFSEISKANIDLESTVAPEAENAGKQTGPPPSQEAVQPPEALTHTANVFGTPAGKTEVHHKVADNSEGCKFAKDLPSFLVPAAPHSLSKETPQTESPVAMGAQQSVGMRKLDRMSPSGEENVSPFGVKLRRTNYSVRFHYDQQAEQKKKKRYSAGDSFDGVPSPLVTPTNEKDANNIFLKESKSPRQERKDTIVISVKDSSATVSHIQATAAPLPVATSGQVSPVSSKEKSVGKSPLPQKPALAPKPVSQTPPSSPLSKMRRSHLMEPVGQKGAKMEPDTSWRKTEPKEDSLLSQVQDASKNDEEECKEKKSFFPSITMPWKEKVEKKPETLKKERPVLQSRHSIDGSKLMDKVESAQPLWITLALQKQKGFREQQATREERRQAREAKQAEKLAKENASINSQTDNKSSHTSRTSAMLKPVVQEEEKKVETVTSRLERREQLKKSNTLPTSVTVEISDSVPTSPLAKEVTKRFSTPDTNPVSTEPAWLALAKRKAKAWSDCPQIINDGEHHTERKIAAIEH